MRKRTRVNDGNRHENTGSGADRTHEVSGDRKQAKDGTTKGGGSRNDTLQLLIHRSLPMASHDLNEIRTLYVGNKTKISRVVDP